MHWMVLHYAYHESRQLGVSVRFSLRHAVCSSHNEMQSINHIGKRGVKEMIDPVATAG
jgi:hypothetical protein